MSHDINSSISAPETVNLQYLSQKSVAKSVPWISQDLLDEIIELQGENSNISTHASDIRSMPLDLSVFDRVLWYASIQYLDLQEVAEFFLKHLTKLPPDSVLFIGDIPDQEKIWEYFKSWEQKKAYFESLKRGQSRVGTWFSSKWLEELSRVAGFHEVLILKQPKNQIYSDFRYDLLATK